MGNVNNLFGIDDQVRLDMEKMIEYLRKETDKANQEKKITESQLYKDLSKIYGNRT